MKTLIYLIVLVFGLNQATAQKTYLQIYETDDLTGGVMYPPGTPFELFDQNNNLILNDHNFEGKFKIVGAYTLNVYPSWKDDADVFKLKTGQIRAIPKYSSGHDSKTTNRDYTSNGVSVEKFLTDSEVYPGKKNVTLEFSNGVVFKYQDGKATATLNGTELKIEGKYLVYSQLGVTKISFNPTNGVVWWVFEPHHN